MSTSNQFTSEVKKVKELIEDVEVAMLVTVDEEGGLSGRPMMVQKVDDDGRTWFFTSKESGKISAILKNQEVNLSFSDPKNSHYVSVSGRAEIIDDQDKVKELWTEAQRAWFPDGPEDSQISLVAVTPDQAEYWDSSSGKLVQFIALTKSLLKGERYEGEGAEHGRVQM